MTNAARKLTCTAPLILGLALAFPAVSSADIFMPPYGEFPVTFTPAQPEAYQPFEVRFVGFRLPETPATIYIEDDTLIIEYLSYERL